MVIGCINSGGTTSGNTVLIGSEIAMSNPAVDLSEIKSAIKLAMVKENNLPAFVAHELVHTHQSGFPFLEIIRLAKNRKLSLLNACLTEGVADFITQTYFGLNINQNIHEYAKPHTRSLMAKAVGDHKTKPFNYLPWLYNYANRDAEYPDLGYYVGFQMAEAYYSKAKNKRKAIRTLLRRGQYKKAVNAWKRSHNFHTSP